MSAVLRERTAPGLHDALAARVAPLVARDAPVLDVGCGTGAWLQRLSDLGFVDLHGTDLDITQFGCASIPVHANDLNGAHWQVGRDHFALLTAIEVIEHLQNLHNFFANVHRLLAPQGLCLLTTPNIHSLHARLRFLLTGELKQFGRIGDPTHLTPILDVLLRRLCTLHGFSVAAEWGYPESGHALGARPWVNGSMRLLRTLLPEAVAGDVYCALLRKL